MNKMVRFLIIFGLFSLSCLARQIPSNTIFFSQNSEKAKQLVYDLQLVPIKSIKVKNATYHFTELFHYDQTIPSDGRKRYGVFAYIEIDNNFYFRFFYKSGSHGIFRLAPFITYASGLNVNNEQFTSVSWYSKGIGEGSLALPPIIQVYLADEINKNNTRTDVSILNILNLITSYNVLATGIEQREGESYTDFYARQDQRFNNFKKVQDDLMANEVKFISPLIKKPTLEEKSFIYKDEERTRTFAIPNSISLINDLNAPNFRSGLVKQSSYDVTYYGNVTGSVYESKNKDISFYVMNNNENKIWIPSLSILGNNSTITSYGVPSEATGYDDNYFLMPLWERSKYIHPNFRSVQVIPREENYQSSWVYLREIDLIKNYYQAKNIDAPKDVN
jgi:hypothetical protein